jgi:hypothetical protein
MAVSGEGPPWEWRGQTVGFAIAFAYLFVFPVWIVISVITISAFWIWSGFKQKTSRKDDTEQTN